MSATEPSRKASVPGTLAMALVALALVGAARRAPAAPSASAGALAPGSDASSTADDPLPLDSLLRAHSYPLLERDGRLAGPGRDVLLEAARGTRFFFVAENHYRAEIPRITSMLFAVLHDRRGYEYLAVENGPYIMRRFSAPPVRGDTAASLALAARYPGGLQFVSDEEIAMFARVGATSTAPHDPLWGLDRPFGGEHVLERLAEAAPDGEARKRVEEVLAEARRYERRRAPGRDARRWIVDVTNDEELSGLRDAVGALPGTAADSMLRALELSHRTYRRFVEAERGEPTGYASNLEREEFMKRQLAFNLRGARREGGDPPRVLFKFGHWHAIRGRNWGDVHTLGGFAASVAKLRGSEAFSLATALVGDPENGTPLGAAGSGLASLAAAGDPHGWRVVDLRPLRPLIHAGLVEGVTPELERWIFGFDAALLIGDSRAATFDRLLEIAGRGG